jgi:hypothetical protein
MNVTEGAGWGEGDAGTNAVGTALAVDHAVQVFAAEHFNEGRPAVDLRGGARAQAVEEHLRGRMRVHDAHLRGRHVERLGTGARSVLVTAGPPGI